jgi:hypothetical protein
MREGTVPVPPYRPCAYCDDDVLPVRGISRGSQSGGGETRGHSDFLGNISRETKINSPINKYRAPGVFSPNLRPGTVATPKPRQP